MAVAVVGGVRSERADEARVARLARAYALLLDTIVFAFLSLIVNGVFGVAQATSSSTWTTTVPWAVLALVALTYFTVPEALFGATLGKYWARVRVVRVDGGPLSLTSVLVRNAMRLVDALPIFYVLGGLSVVFSPNSQRLGDFLAGTTVVYRHHARGASRHASHRALRYARLTLYAAIVFTIAFDYFGRPALVIEGAFNTHSYVFFPAMTSYSLGQPQWGFGRVRYPLTGYEWMTPCAGYVSLNWEWPVGWTFADGSLSCPP
jgi:uncharacterized RDD family membrane protein YckC